MTQTFFSRRLKELRERAGLTRKQLADQVGLHYGGLAKLEQGQRVPLFETVAALARALGVDCRDFVEPVSDQPTADETPHVEEPISEPTPRGRPKKKVASEIPEPETIKPVEQPTKKPRKKKGE